MCHALGRLRRISRNSFGPLISLRLRRCRSASVASRAPTRSISCPPFLMFRWLSLDARPIGEHWQAQGQPSGAQPKSKRAYPTRFWPRRRARLPPEAIGDVQVVVRGEPLFVVKTSFAPSSTFRCVQASKPAWLWDKLAFFEPSGQSSRTRRKSQAVRISAALGRLDASKGKKLLRRGF
jgi:hypothetical protein